MKSGYGKYDYPLQARPAQQARHPAQARSRANSACVYFLVGLVTSLLSPAAFSQSLPAPSGSSGPSSSGSGELLEIVVTAQRRQQNLQNVPVTVEAFSAEQLNASVLTSITDLGTVTPGLVAPTQFGYFQPHLRAIGTTAPSSSVENPIAVYVDGIYYGAQAGSIFSLAGIDHVEVDKGPQGTLFGRNATGGLIQIITKDPVQQFSGTASVTAGDYATFGGSVYVTGGITPTIAANLSAYFQNQGTGFGTNYLTGLEVNKNQDIAIREKTLFTPTEHDSVMLAVDYEQNHSSPVLVPAPGTTPFGGTPYTGSPWSANGLYQPDVLERQGGISLKIDHDLGFAHLESMSAYLNSKLFSAFDGTFITDPTYGLNIILWDVHQQFTQEFDLRSEADSALTWTAGIYYYNATAKYDPIGLVGGYIAPLTGFSTLSKATNYSIAAFGQATKEILPATNLTLGLRETYEDKRFSEAQYGSFPDGSFVSFGSVSGVKLNSHEPTWRVSVDHKLTPDALLYVSYNHGYKTGGFNDEYLPVKAYAPETLDAYEIGAKTDTLGHRLRLDAAAFHYNYKNLQTVAYPAGTELIYNAPGANINGLDLDLQAVLFKNFSLSGGFEILRAKYRDFPGAQLSLPATGGGSTLSSFDAAGRQLPLAPKWTMDLSPLYTVPLGTSGNLKLGATISYNDGFYYEPDNRFRQGAYKVVNASVAWDSSSEEYSVRLWGKNLTNEVYTTAMYAQTNADYAQYAAPRTFGITASWNF